MSEWDAPVDDRYLQNEHFAQFIKQTPYGPAWAVTRVKAAMRPVFEALENVENADELAWLLEGSRFELEACWCSIPEWCFEFEERIMAIGIMPRFEVRPAERAIRNVILGIVGEPGGGKTCSALRLARGLAGDGDIVLIDTEQGRATAFAPRAGEVVSGEFDPDVPLFHFGIIELDAPYTPERYRLAVAAAARSKPRVLIIDNITEEMYGEGGMLDVVKALGGEVTHWKEPRDAHRRLVNKLNAHPWYVILTIRADSRTRIEKKPGQKMNVEQVPALPMCDKSFYFSCMMMQLVDGGVPNGATERPWKIPPALRRLMTPGRPFDEDTGRRIAEWCQPRGTWAEEHEE